MKKLQLDEERAKKLDNFWYYYKFHVFGAVFALFCIGIFVKDMFSKVDYDYNVGFLGDYGIQQEDHDKLQAWFEANGEDLNGDGEVHVQIGDYCMSEDTDPQMLAASQTKFMVDVQDGTSMIFFLSQGNVERFREMEIFPPNEEAFVSMKECKGFEEAGSPESVQDLSGTMRIVMENSKVGRSEEKKKYYEECEKLLKKFIGE